MCVRDVMCACRTVAYFFFSNYVKTESKRTRRITQRTHIYLNPLLGRDWENATFSMCRSSWLDGSMGRSAGAQSATSELCLVCEKVPSK